MVAWGLGPCRWNSGMGRARCVSGRDVLASCRAVLCSQATVSVFSVSQDWEQKGQ